MTEIFWITTEPSAVALRKSSLYDSWWDNLPDAMLVVALREDAPYHVHPSRRSGEIGIRTRLKIWRPSRTCRFESDLRHHLHRYSKASSPGAFLFADMWTINLSSFPTFL